jgi:hypothetical protein
MIGLGSVPGARAASASQLPLEMTVHSAENLKSIITRVRTGFSTPSSFDTSNLTFRTRANPPPHFYNYGCHRLQETHSLFHRIRERKEATAAAATVITNTITKNALKGKGTPPISRLGRRLLDAVGGMDFETRKTKKGGCRQWEN